MKNAPLTILAILGIAIMLISTTAYSWTFIKVRETVAQVSLTAEEAELLATKNAHTQTVRRVIRDTEEERGELNSYFVTDEEIVEFLEDIEALGNHSRASVAVQSVEAGPAVDKDGLVTPLRVTLKVEGALQEVFHSLALLETFPKVLTVEDAHIVQHPTNPGWFATFNIQVMKVGSSEDS